MAAPGLKAQGEPACPCGSGRSEADCCGALHRAFAERGLLLAPSALFMLVLFVWPLAEAISIAFTDESGVWSLQNFRAMADDLNFTDAARNTVLLVAVVVPLQLALALALAVLLGNLHRGRDIHLYVWTIPLGISDLAAGIGPG